MSQNFYSRTAVPVGEQIVLEVQFKDVAGYPKDADSWPTIEITDAANEIVVASTSSGISRTAKGRYKYILVVPDGYVNGLWNDSWSSELDGYSNYNVFDFTVDSTGAIEVTGSSVPERVYTLEDDDIAEDFSQLEIKGILRLRKFLKAKMRTTAYKPDGTPCPVMPNDQLDLMLCSALSEFNATPILTGFGFDSQFIQTVAADIITQGAMLIAWSGQAIIEAGFEFNVNDNGVTYNAPPVSTTISSMYSGQLSEYRAKLKEIKRNLRPAPLGLGAGSLLVESPRFRRLRLLRERRII